MQKKNYDIKKVTDYLWKNGVNVSSRVKTYPETDSKTIKEDYSIDRINLGADGLDGSYYIRVSFKGSDRWYKVPIKKDTIDEWWNIVKFIIDELSKMDDFVNIEEEMPF